MDRTHNWHGSCLHAILCMEKLQWCWNNTNASFVTSKCYKIHQNTLDTEDNSNDREVDDICIEIFCLQWTTVPVPVQPMIAPVCLGHLLRCFRTNLQRSTASHSWGIWSSQDCQLVPQMTNKHRSTPECFVVVTHRGSDTSWLAKQQT